MIDKIREVFKVREQSVSEKVLQMLWDGDDIVRIVNFAAENGMTEEAITSLAEKVASTKSTFERGNAVQMGKLQQAYGLAKKKLDEEGAKLALAEEAHGDASIAFCDASDALRIGNEAVRAALDVLNQGVVPKNVKLSSGITDLIEKDAKYAEREREKKVLRDEIHALQNKNQELYAKLTDLEIRSQDILRGGDQHDAIGVAKKEIEENQAVIAKKMKQVEQM
jgi:hypothetical protein